MELQELIDTFYSNYNASIDYEALENICQSMSDGYLKVIKIEICSLNVFQNTLDKVLNGKTPIFEYDGGGKKHIALKIAAGKYILKKFGQKCDYEENYCGQRPDVISKDKDIIFECGDTDPRKILEYLGENENLKIFVMPYHRIEDGKLICGFLFIKNKNGLATNLYKRKIDSLADVRKIIASRK
ncbi:MAG: hypothetical protein HZC05_01455 [Candidatus Magasanikbacteria bacterium]|nr:hypothetical protein [Candidatus Magasanikbacteria bacterium]